MANHLKQVEGTFIAVLAKFALFAKYKGRPEVHQWAEDTLARLGFFNALQEDIASVDKAIRGGLLGYAAAAALDGNTAAEKLAMDAFVEFGYALQLAALKTDTTAPVA